MNAAHLSTAIALVLLGVGAPFAGTWGLWALGAAAILGLFAASRGSSLAPAPRWAARGVAVIAPLVLLAAFTARTAAPNVVIAGQKATERMAVASLRTLVWAQDKFIELHGRAGLIGELSGAQGVDGGPPVPVPLLRPPFRALKPTPVGQAAAFQGYLFSVHVGEATDGRGPVPAGARPWVACAWPIERGVSAAAAFCVNQDEDIVQTANDAAEQGYDGWRRPVTPGAWKTGAHGDRLRPGTGADGGAWTWWRGKQTRRSKAADRARQ